MDTLILNKDHNPLSIVPLSVVPWQTAIRLAYQDKVYILANYEHWQVRSPSTTMNVPSVVVTSEYIKWNRHVKYNRTNVYLRDNFTCQLCGEKDLPPSQLTLDHVVPRKHGGKTNWKNIVTACRKCNHAKGDDRRIVPKKMPERPSYYELIAKRMHYPITVRDESWLFYLQWPEDKIMMKVPKENRPHE
jgi:5-methylcytosine-specific restriction endonuclease McrA